jgi:hypothetical protein
MNSILKRYFHFEKNRKTEMLYLLTHSHVQNAR